MRRIRAAPLSRRNLDAYVKQLGKLEPQAWPKFLYNAWAIIAEDLKKPNVAREAVICAVAAAHTCAVAAVTRGQSNARSKSRQKVLAAAKGISTCIRRIQAAVRDALNEVARREFREGHADTEAIANFLNGCGPIVAKYPNFPLAVKLLNNLQLLESLNDDSMDVSEPRTVRIANEFEAMHPNDRAAAEVGLKALLAERSSKISALDVFSKLAESLQQPSIAETRENVGDLHLAYVSGVANVLRRLGLDLGRSHYWGHSDHRGWFHHFLELVLRDYLNPHSRLAGVAPTNRLEWLITDDNLKTVIKAGLQKSS
jgi:hypothetical protein